VGEEESTRRGFGGVIVDYSLVSLVVYVGETDRPVEVELFVQDTSIGRRLKYAFVSVGFCVSA
jgi:hypothetical protein